MTRNEQPTSGLYDEDFFRWTQQQAEILRALEREPNAIATRSDPSQSAPSQSSLAQLDLANLAEEVADLGKRDLREVLSYLRLVIQHLVKLAAAPGSREAAHWHAEAVNFQLLARQTFSPSMRQLIDVGEVWTGGSRAAGRFLREHGARDPSTDPCPFTLDELLAADFDVDTAVARVQGG